MTDLPSRLVAANDEFELVGTSPRSSTLSPASATRIVSRAVIVAAPATRP